MIKLLLRYQLQKIKKIFLSRKTAKLIVLACFIAIFTGLGVAVYFFFVKGFSYIQSYPFFAQAVTLYSYEVYLLFIFLLIAISSFISSLFSLFKKEKNDWLLATPSYKILPGVVLVNAFFASLWPLIIIVLPSLLAAHSVFGLKLIPLLVSLLSIVFLTIFATSLMLLAILITGRMLQGLSSLINKNFLNLKNLAICLLIFVFFGGILIWHQNFSIDLISLFNAQDLQTSESVVSRISENFTYSPTHPVAKAIFEFQAGNVIGGYYYTTIMFLMTIIVLSFLWLATEWFLPIWQKLQEGLFTARTKIKNKNTKKDSFIWGKNVSTTLLKKEFLVSSRNTRGLLWFGFLMFIWMIQVGVNLMLSKNIAKYSINIDLFPIIAYILQFLTGIFFISAFVLRFVFPCFSMEKDTSWILSSSPMKKSKIFWSKLLFYLPLFLTIGILIGYTNLLILNLSLTASVITFILFFSTIIFIVVLGLSLGAIFPNFETDDPSVLSTSLPGIGFTIGSLSYGSIGAWLLFQNLTANIFWPICLFLILSFIGTIWLIYIALYFLKHMEFIKNKF